MLDFKLMFENANDSRLVDVWPEIKNIPFEKFGIRIDKAKCPGSRKNDDIFKMLMFLKLIPTPRHSFEKAMHSFMIFSEVVYQEHAYK